MLIRFRDHSPRQKAGDPKNSECEVHMQIRKVLPVFILVLATVSSVVAQPAKAAGKYTPRMQTALLRGPLAQPSGAVAAPGYGLRTC